MTFASHRGGPGLGLAEARAGRRAGRRAKKALAWMGGVGGWPYALRQGETLRPCSGSHFECELGPGSVNLDLKP